MTSHDNMNNVLLPVSHHRPAESNSLHSTMLRPVTRSLDEERCPAWPREKDYCIRDDQRRTHGGAFHSFKGLKNHWPRCFVFRAGQSAHVRESSPRLQQHNGKDNHSHTLCPRQACALLKTSDLSLTWAWHSHPPSKHAKPCTTARCII